MRCVWGGRQPSCQPHTPLSCKLVKFAHDSASAGVGGVAAVGVFDGGDDAVAVVDGFDPLACGFVFVNVNVDVGDSSGIKVAGQALAEGAPGGGVEGEFIHCLSPYIGDVFVP